MYKDISKIVTVVAVDGYKLAITFDGGVSGIVNLSQYKSLHF